MDTLIAIDTHKETSTYAIFENATCLEETPTIPSTPEAFTTLVETYPEAHFAIEACGVNEWIVDHLRTLGADVQTYTPPKRENKGKKNDGDDAKRLGRKVLIDDVNPVHVPTPELRRLRDLIRHREFLKQKRTSAKNRLAHELNRWNVTERSRETVIETHPHLEDLYAIINELGQRIHRLNKRVEREAPEIHEVNRLMTIPGFGALTALAFHIETGPITRFPDAESLVSYYGLDPVAGQSGNRYWDEHRISKKGNGLIRGLVTNAAWIHTHNAPGSSLTQAYHYQREVKGKEPRDAITVVARKLVKTAYWLLRDDRDFTLTGPARLRACRTPSYVDQA